MDPALYEAVLYVGVDIQITPKHNSMDQQTDVFNDIITPNHTAMDSNLYEAVKDGDVQYLDQHTHLFDTELTPNHNTILHVAAHFGKFDCVAKILEKKPCLIRWVNSNNENPLQIAVREQYYDIVQGLIDRAKELDQELESGGGIRLKLLRAINGDGDTALHLAVRERDARIVSLLMGEDPDFQHPANKAKETPLYLAAEGPGGYSVVDSILASCKLPACTGPSGRTALHAAASIGNSAGLKKLLDRYEELIDKADTEGWTPLHYAVYRGHLGTVRELLKRNKSVGYTRTSEKHDKSTALHIAAAAECEDMMKEILSHCPDCWEMVDSKGRNILHIAVNMEAEDVINYIIKQDWLGSLVNQKDFEDNTPLHLLASSENLKYRDDLINHPKANKHAFNNQNSTPAEVTMEKGLSTNKDSWRRKPKGKRNIAEGEAQENRRQEQKRTYPEIEKEKEEANVFEAVKKASENHMLVATLIATITFAAGFAIPGGYDGNQGPQQGMAVLVRQASFKAFVIANTIAVMCSTSSVVYYVFAEMYYHNVDQKMQCFEKGFYLVLIAIGAMTAGFISGTYAMLHHSLGLAIATSIIASITFLVYFLEFCRYIKPSVQLWLYRLIVPPYFRVPY